MENDFNKKKLSTGIRGLDDLFYGGIQLDHHYDNSDGLLILARGEHGVNKIHLAMQMCEGMYISQKEMSSFSNSEGEAIETYNPLSIENTNRTKLLITLLLKDTIKLVYKFVEKQAKNEEFALGEGNDKNKWEELRRKIASNPSFAYKSAKRILGTLFEKKTDIVDSYWNHKKDKESVEYDIKRIIESKTEYGMLLLKLLVVEETTDETIRIIRNYAEKQKSKKGLGKDKAKWIGFCAKISKNDDVFAKKCSTKYIEVVLEEKSNLLDLYWKHKKDQKDIEKALKSSLESYSNLFLSIYLEEETIDEVTRMIREFAEKQKNEKSLKEGEAKSWEAFYKRMNGLDDTFARKCAMKFIEDRFRGKDDLINQYRIRDKHKNEVTKELNNDIKKNGDELLFYTNKHIKDNVKILFISLNKDGESLKSKYYDFYIQRLIRNVRNKNKYSDSSLKLLHRMIWYEDKSCCEYDKLGKPEKRILDNYQFPSIIGKSSHYTVDFEKHVKSGYIYYNGRTHGLHLRHQKGAPDTGDLLLCKLFIPEDSLVKIIGRDELNNGNRMADGLTTFNNLLTVIDQYGINKSNRPYYIMVDGLSRLTKEEIPRCPFNALSDKLRKACKVGVLTADEKLKSSEISIDIIIDMAIKERPNPDQLYHALRISKCLYQRNAYGWHNYKMRMSGIEVIPSIHFQMITRYLMEDVVADALLSIDEDPYPYWLNETDLYDDDKIKDGTAFEKYEQEKQICNESCSSSLKGFIYYDRDSAMKSIIENLVSNDYKDHHFLFIDLNYNRTEFKHKYYNTEFLSKIKEFGIIHLFNFQPGFLHADEFMWAIDQQIQAIANLTKETKKKSNELINAPDTHFDQIHVIVGDLNYLNFAYPCLNKDGLVLPAIAAYTKKHHMTNYVYAAFPKGDVNMLDREAEICRQLLSVVRPENMLGLYSAIK